MKLLFILLFTGLSYGQSFSYDEPVFPTLSISTNIDIYTVEIGNVTYVNTHGFDVVDNAYFVLRNENYTIYKNYKLLYKKYKMLFFNVLRKTGWALISKCFEHTVEIGGTIKAYFISNLATVHF